MSTKRKTTREREREKERERESQRESERVRVRESRGAMDRDRDLAKRFKSLHKCRHGVVIRDVTSCYYAFDSGI